MYDELVKKIRHCATDPMHCLSCGEDKDGRCFKRIMTKAADAIEKLEHQVFLADLACKAEASKAPHWIPVSERLPDVFKHVLVNIPGMSPFPTVQDAFREKNGMWYSNCFRYGADEITHWRPLPEPPDHIGEVTKMVEPPKEET